jgi:hypothetical protein
VLTLERENWRASLMNAAPRAPSANGTPTPPLGLEK